MRDIKRIVNTSFWEDDLVLNKFSPEDKYFMLYLLTNQYTSQLGIYHFPVRRAALDLGYSEEAVKTLLERFTNKYGVIKYSESTNEVAIKNYLKHSIVKGGKPVFDCLVKETSQVKDKALLIYIYNNLLIYKDILNITVIDYINYLNTYINNININNSYIYNDNDNERIVDDSCTDVMEVTESRINTRFIVPTLDEVKDYCFERNNNVDAQTFIDFYESKGWLIGKNKMKDWKAAVRTWEKRNNKPSNTNNKIDWDNV